jgi:hypothetical protein
MRKITIVSHPLSGYTAGEVVIENKGQIEKLVFIHFLDILFAQSFPCSYIARSIRARKQNSLYIECDLRSPKIVNINCLFYCRYENNTISWLTSSSSLYNGLDDVI